MTKQLFSDIRARVEAATEGPWDQIDDGAGFDAGAEAMRTYMQAEMDKLVDCIEKYLASRRVVDKELDWDAYEQAYRAWKENKSETGSKPEEK